jgi:hypothetical protein
VLLLGGEVQWGHSAVIREGDVGRRVRITRADLERVIQEGYRPGAAAAREEALTAQGFWDGQDHPLPEADQSSGSAA